MSVITVGAFEAKTKLAELLRRVEQGDEVIITRHGKPVARLLSHDTKRSPGKVRKALEDLEALRKSMKGRDIDWRAWKEEGRL
ncbi:MAG TPA: type II toxin-antitoxin system prevent-host-death family antitoxin [Thermopetrobacter sp.]|nr:type II toxin-antitoxin system prevent-host-death family antitoxin [Thermopetrobacter sp.]